MNPNRGRETGNVDAGIHLIYLNILRNTFLGCPLGRHPLRCCDALSHFNPFDLDLSLYRKKRASTERPGPAFPHNSERTPECNTGMKKRKAPPKDFAKKKQKVGSKSGPRPNETNTSFTAKSAPKIADSVSRILTGSVLRCGSSRSKSCHGGR